MDIHHHGQGNGGWSDRGEGSGGCDGKGRDFRWAGRTVLHFSPRVPKLRARERIERASIILSGGALVLAVERASSLSRAEAASHGPSVMACRDPAPAQTPRYRGASARAVHAAADSRNPPGVGLCRQVPAVHLRPSLCQSRWWHLCCDSAPECN